MDVHWIVAMAGGPEGGSGTPWMLVWFGLIFVLIYLTMIRPQSKRQKEHKQLLSELKKGDRIVTSSGMFGTIFAIDDDKGRVVVKIGDDTKLEFLKTSIAAKVDK